MFWDSSREASPTNERSLELYLLLVLGGLLSLLVCNFQIKERSSCFVVWRFLSQCGFLLNKETSLCIWVLVSKMSMKMKGIYKGFKSISHMFGTVKEREIEIGYPTDVKHVSHIGWEGSSGSAPSWMSEFKAGAEVLSPRPSSFAGNARNSSSFFSTCSSTDYDQASSTQPATVNTPRDLQLVDHPNVHSSKKKSKKKKSSSSPRSKSSSKSSNHSVMSKTMYKSTINRI